MIQTDDKIFTRLPVANRQAVLDRTTEFNRLREAYRNGQSKVMQHVNKPRCVMADDLKDCQAKTFQQAVVALCVMVMIGIITAVGIGQFLAWLL